MANEIIEYVFSIADTDGSSSNVVMNVRFATTPTLADIQGIADDLGLLIDATIDGKIWQTAFRFVLVTATALTTKVVPANIEVQVGATMSFKNENLRRFSWFFPTFKKTLLPNGLLNTADTAVAALINWMLGITDPTIDVVDANLLDIADLGSVRGKETTRKLSVGRR